MTTVPNIGSQGQPIHNFPIDQKTIADTGRRVDGKEALKHVMHLPHAWDIK